ncbi:carbamoyltransferase HypF [Ferrovum myxofaciens]|uniref:Carbamoyltransferase HypF n=2 Tax=root TaxID=1 RepID=A0A9E6SY04_9PROT|nr:carbamoyltransferase HypF [Ferrovum myxofaciens]QKE37549.1 MAG: carbamoyltransferase HypF [Ferrovum myxofaciens]QKE40107.1 MAG: carbamoyltransferase HypF [Ferrovum myxofaciens]QWY75201.1 MAG: carbamoyltransferase HypF [Ferrovum myxofaciens]QWY77934.1 MAG: carbamoyltransferase HypF [Ferrovum myxofaciens]
MIHARIRVSGQVQGVGFRPFVFRLAHELGLAGWVRNDSSGVEISVEGKHSQVLCLIERLQSEPPALARVEKVIHDLEQVTSGLRGFSIAPSKMGRMQTGIVPDMAICPDCLSEMFDPADRRYRHPFINCIHCGPRYTLTARLPYDRANTSMAKFTQCPDCQQEYDNPGTRRFHAQPNACPACGPHLSLFDELWRPVTSDDCIASAARYIASGQIVAIKSVGGFHLVCDAGNPATVDRLRSRKQRDEKPFAVMVLNRLSAERYAEVLEHEAALLEAGERPIVLLRKSASCDTELRGISPDLSDIGLMLPYTPLQYLLFHELSGKPEGTDWLQKATSLALVMTSANFHGEPLVKDDAEARASLSGLSDAFLTHDREILHRCDDSVMRTTPSPLWGNFGQPSQMASCSIGEYSGEGQQFQLIRRARGYTPRRILLPHTGPSILACGAWLKNTVCLTRGNEAFVSQHIGDLDHAATRQMLDETVAHLCDILDVRPQAVAHDLHPDFYSTQFAQAYAAQHGLSIFAVQHHHAHIAAVCAEHHVTESVLGLALDGMGLGTDGNAWGGELLRVEGADFQRLGHLAPLSMPGGDRAAREPWRLAAAVLFEMGRSDEIMHRFPAQTGSVTVITLLQRQLNCATTSSMGRLFDAAAGLLNVREIQSYEGQAAILLEGLAEQHGKVAALTNGYVISNDGVLDFLPLLAAITDCKNASYGAALFHATLADGLMAWLLRAAENENINTVALGGGCFLNRILSQTLISSLYGHGLRVLTAQQLPPNDGGISFGQANIALTCMTGISSMGAIESPREFYLKSH